MEETFILNELKKLILSKIGIRAISPSDCKRISIEISKELNKTVSETTIKRLFGFAKTEHKFSRFTLTTLLEYVNKEDLTRLLSKSTVRDGDEFNDWTIIKDNARRVTELTIKGIKHRSGLPYHMTLGRKFAEKDFEDFYASDHSFTCFISRPRHGRTILLSHLAEKYFIYGPAEHQNSVLLFVNAANLFNNEYKTFNLEEQLKIQLSVSPVGGLINYIDSHYKKKEGKFTLFIDGFSDLIRRRDLKFQVFESIINFISALDGMDSIKLVMSMRSTTWSRFYEHIRHSAHLRSKWFPGNYFSPDDFSNVPLLTGKEVDQIIFKISPSISEPIDIKLKSQLKYPFHFELYYQLKEEDPNFNQSSGGSFHELITKFIQEKIYRSNYYTEKILFLKKLIQLTNYAKNGSSVAKDDLLDELATFKNAYMELLSGGILIEERQAQNGHPKEYVRFSQPHIFEYFLFVELLEKYHLKLDHNFFKQVNTDYSATGLNSSLLQWAIRFLVRIGDVETLNLIFSFDLPHQEKNKIILFALESLQYRLPYSIETLLLVQKYNFHHHAIDYFSHFDILDASYQKSLSLLLEIADTQEHKLTYLALLSLIDALSLDENSLSLRISQTERLKESASSWFISPYDFVWLIHQKIRDNQITQHPILKKIEDFKQDHTTFEIKGTDIGCQDLITCLYMYIINLFFGSSAELVKLIGSILKAYPTLFHKRSVFSTSVMSLLAIGCARTSPGEKTEQMESILGKLAENKNRITPTKNTLAIYKFLIAEQNRNRGNYEVALKHAVECLDYYLKGNIHAISLIVYNLILKIYTNMQDFEKVNEYKYEKYTFLEERNIPQHLFPFLVNAHQSS